METTYTEPKKPVGQACFEHFHELIPPHAYYVEGFSGVQGMFRGKRHASSLLVEKDFSLFPVYGQAGYAEVDHAGMYLLRRDEERLLCLNGDLIELLRDQRLALDAPGTFIFLDPPKPFDPSRQGWQSTYMLSEAQHYELLTVVQQYLWASIAVVTYPNLLYRASLSNWYSIGTFKDKEDERSHAEIWMNYRLVDGLPIIE